MKRYLLYLILTLLATNIQGSDHIMFMGIEVNGSNEVFNDSLVARGFTYLNSYEIMQKYYGKFANEIVILNVLASPKTKTVCKVIVYFPKRFDWEELKKDYFAKKEMYKSKYPLDKEYEFFSSPYDEGDGYEMRAVERGKCKYISFFFAMGGYITIEIDEGAKMKVVYEDRQNMKIAQDEMKEKALDDI